jgi:pimeloyl-ACP methyl ester carboxylesterase
MKPSFAAIVLLLGLSSPAAAAPDLLERWVIVDGMRIRYLEAGDTQSERPAILMIHGWAGSAEDFRPLFDLLPPTVRAIAVDLPGCGQSDKPDAVYDLPYFVTFLKAFCDTLGLERIMLVGHSMGGQFAVHFTTRWPGIVQRLVLIAPYGLKGEEGIWLGLAGWGGFVDLGFRLNNKLFIEWALRANVLYQAAPAIVHAAVESTARSILGPESSRAIARITRNVIGHDSVEGLLPAVEQETLIIWGDHDKVLAPSWATTFLTQIPRARLVMVKDSGHMPMIEHPEETAGLIAGFLGA